VYACAFERKRFVRLRQARWWGACVAPQPHTHRVLGAPSPHSLLRTPATAPLLAAQGIVTGVVEATPESAAAASPLLSSPAANIMNSQLYKLALGACVMTRHDMTCGMSWCDV
jgi:hypothetical protein